MDCNNDGDDEWDEDYTPSEDDDIPEWDPDLEEFVSDKDKEAAESAYRDFLANPEKYADYYLNPNPTSNPDEYFYLELFVKYSELNKQFSSANDIIWLAVAERYGQEEAEAMSDQQIRNFQNELVYRDEAAPYLVTFSTILVLFGHGARHLKGTGLEVATVELMIDQQIQTIAQTQQIKGPFWGTIKIDGYTIDYRAYPLGDKINVGTYTIRPR